MLTLDFTASTINGYVYETEFVFEKTNLPSYNILTWDFGDGTFVYNPSSDEVKHTYVYPGVYKVSLSAWNQIGTLETNFQYVNVDYKIRDALLFTKTPSEWGIVGHKTIEPFTINLTSAKIDEPLAIVLHSIGSKSVPYNTLKDKWRFIVPTWYFVNASTNKIVNGPIAFNTTPIYGLNNKVIAVSATQSFYYIDRTATISNASNDPVIITATLSTQNFAYPPESLVYPYYSYSNTDTVKAAVLCHIYDVLPNELKITENYLQQIYPYKWTQTKIPILINYRFNPDLFGSYNYGTGVSATDVFSYPKTNISGSTYPLTIALKNVTPKNYSVENHSYVHTYSTQTSALSSRLYFKATDESGAVSSGYVFTGLTSLCAVDSAQITATTQLDLEQPFSNDFAFPIGLPLSYKAYIAHAFESNINEIRVDSFYPKSSQVQALQDKGLILEGQIQTIGVPSISSTNTNNLTLSGASGIYAIAYNPAKKLLYAADSDSNKVYMYDDNKTLINTLELSTTRFDLFYSFFEDEAVLEDFPISPSSLSIDKDHNVWVALYDNSLVLKYTYDLTTRLASAAPMPYLLDLYNNIDPNNEPYSSPSIVKTDQENNIWVCYSHPLSSSLIKYDSDGKKTNIEINFPSYTIPADLAISKENNVWVACYESNKILQYDGQTGNLSSVNSFDLLRPSYIAVDKQNNLWSLHGYNLITKYDTQTQQASTWSVQNFPSFEYNLIRNKKVNLSEYTLAEVRAIYGNNEIWSGLAVDLFNRVWAVNSETNTAVLIPVNEPMKPKVISLIPTSTTNYYIPSIEANYVKPIENGFVKSAQAVGDWTGNEWYQKFGQKFEVSPLSGVSNTFKILDLYKDAPAVAKVNENFNYGEYFKSLALPELLQQNDNLFDEFLTTLVGSGSLDAEEIGRVLYEKIANFNINHTDIDTAEISHLTSLLAQLKLEAQTFGVDFPVEIQRLLNIFSIPLRCLRGQPIYDTDVVLNIGEQLTFTSLISAGQYIYLRDRFYDTYQLFEVEQNDDGEDVYPLSALKIEGLREYSNINNFDIFENYYFYNYDAYKIIGYQSNIIDWENPYTTINYTASSWDFYYEDGGFVDLYFNNLLTKRLFDK